MMTGNGQVESGLVADELVQMARVDTAFADLYLQRGCELLSTELTEAQYAELQQLDRELERLKGLIATAVEAREWVMVRDLTNRAENLRHLLSDRAAVRTAAAKVYGFDEVLVDPFSPGISALAGVGEHDVPALCDAAVKRLERLRAADPIWAELYEARRKALAELRRTLVTEAALAADSVATLEARIQRALADGDLAQLHQLSAQLLDAERRPGATATIDDRGRPNAPALANPFPRDACDRAARLGLRPHRLESMLEHMRARFRPSWTVSPGDPSGNTMRLSITVPGDTDEAQREALTLFANRAFVTSAGTRYVPSFAEEDVLVEDFDERAPDATQGSSPLLAALGLPRRHGLARNRIEKALRDRGAAILKDLGLDPRCYRVVCLPADLYTRLGSKLGWGQQPIWTHFDGYVASNERKLMPLVGGDVRFGGLHDLVAVSAGYDSDRLFTRFAIVQRLRFACADPSQR